jgi:hypothetical protein
MNTTGRLTDEEALAMLATAARAMLDSLMAAQNALEKADREKADKAFHERLHEELTAAGRVSREDVRRLKTIHPLDPLMRLVARLSRGLERILALTNPDIIAQRKLAEVRAVHAARAELKQSARAATA